MVRVEFWLYNRKWLATIDGGRIHVAEDEDIEQILRAMYEDFVTCSGTCRTLNMEIGMMIVKDLNGKILEGEEIINPSGVDKKDVYF